MPRKKGKGASYGLGDRLWHHISKAADLELTDPTRHGTGYPGDDVARVANNQGRPRTYFMVGENPEFEPGLVGTRYIATLDDLDRVYDLDADPEGLRDFTREGATIPPKKTDFGTMQGSYDRNKHLTLVEEEIANRGYRGFTTTDSRGKVGVLFDEQEVMPYTRLATVDEGKAFDFSKGEYTSRLSAKERELLMEGIEDLPRVAKTGQYIGAPKGVDSPEKLLEIRARYLMQMEAGESGRRWYHDTSADIENAYRDPELAARSFGRTSQGAAVDANTMWGARSMNEAAAGRDVTGGRFPASGTDLTEHPFQEFGEKLEPFSQNLRVSWDPTVGNRPVHDIWDGRAWGYWREDGKPWDQGFSPAQHRFMDDQADVVTRVANATGLGGHSDWDHLSAQAGAWTGAKINSGSISPRDAAKHYGDYFMPLTARLTRETLPGRTTNHLSGLLEDPALAVEYDRAVREAMYPEGKDEFSRSMGLGNPWMERGVGVYEGEVAPGHVAGAITGNAPGTRDIDPASRELLEASEATYALLNAQDAYGFNRPNPKDTKLAEINAASVDIGRPLTESEMGDITARIGELYPDAFPALSNTGVDIIWPGRGADAKVGRQFKKDVTQAINDSILEPNSVSFNRAETGFLPNDWRESQSGQEYVRDILKGSDETIARADAVAKRMARIRNDVDLQFAGRAGAVNENIMKVREIIAEGGVTGLHDAIKKGIVPMALITTLLGNDAEASVGPLMTAVGMGDGWPEMKIEPGVGAIGELAGYVGKSLVLGMADIFGRLDPSVPIGDEFGADSSVGFNANMERLNQFLHGDEPLTPEGYAAFDQIMQHGAVQEILDFPGVDVLLNYVYEGMQAREGLLQDIEEINPRLRGAADLADPLPL